MKVKIFLIGVLILLFIVVLGQSKEINNLKGKIEVRESIINASWESNQKLVNKIYFEE